MRSSCVISVFDRTNYKGDIFINNASLNGYFAKIYNQTVATSLGQVVKQRGSDFTQINH